MRLAPRVDYDEIAHRYNSQPYRERAPDAELSGFVEQRSYGDALVVLDVGCGTGNQLIANRVAAPGGLLVGVDCSHGMLRQARVKAPDLAWVHGDAAALPLASRCTAYVGCQFAFHHFADKAGALREVLRVLRPGGRFVLRNLCPQRSGDWLYYAYFPQARVIDLEDFWPPEAVVAVMEGIGFVAVTAAYEDLHFEQNLKDWLAVVRRRDSCSQLQAISDAAYEAGLNRLEREVADRPDSPRRADHLSLVTIRGSAHAA